MPVPFSTIRQSANFKKSRLSEVKPIGSKIGDTDACLASMERFRQAHAEVIQPFHGLHSHFSGTAQCAVSRINVQ
jgi:hypothetical protein